ncbi:MAG: YraN family protein [Opitutales bacterium]|nr:YraN family protein [Opitutales bacterium]
MDEILGFVLRCVGRFFAEVVAAGIWHAFLAVVDFFERVFRKLFGKNPSKKKKTWRRERGDAGEKFAADFLKKQCGMKILCRNFRAGKDEIDLVARDGETLVFVEVKTRSEHDARGAVFAVDARKKQALRRAADAYLRDLRERPAATRLDVVEVYVCEADGEMRAVHHCGVSWRISPGRQFR